jgi:hypothetical protein
MLEVEIGCTLHLSFDIKIQKDTIALLQFIRKTFIFSMLTLLFFFLQMNLTMHCFHNNKNLPFL